MPGHLFLDYVDPWINWDWLSTHVPVFLAALQEHITLTLIAVVVGLSISLPMGVVAHRWRALRNPVLTVFGIFYTIPSIALFALLIPYTGLGTLTAEIGLVGYAVLILTRNVVVGLEAVPKDVLDAANGMGYRPLARLLRVELPLALPAIFAGLRIATVSTISIATVAAFVIPQGLGRPIFIALEQDVFKTEILTAGGLAVALALVADGFLVLLQRVLTPWSRLERQA